MDTNTQTPTAPSTANAGPDCAPLTGSPAWKIGDEAMIATMDGMHWVYVIDVHKSGEVITVLSERGSVEYWESGSLLTREQYLRSCDYMRDDWTGAHYKAMRALADRPFTKPEKWSEWLARATGQKNN